MKIKDGIFKPPRPFDICVVNDSQGHRFKIGTKVRVIALNENGTLYCRGGVEGEIIYQTLKSTQLEHED